MARPSGASRAAQIYPIETDPRPRGGERNTIARMHLSSADMGTDEEAATALGYVAHVVQLLGKVWALPAGVWGGGAWFWGPKMPPKSGSSRSGIRTVHNRANTTANLPPVTRTVA